MPRLLAAALTLSLLAPSLVAAAPTEHGRVGFSVLSEASQTSVAAVKRLVPYAAGLVQPLLDADLIEVNAHGASDAQLASACNEGQVNAVVVFFYADKSTVEGSKLHELAEAHLDVFDCFGDIAFDGAGSAEALVPLASAGDGAYAEARIATDRAFAALRSDVRTNGSTLANLVRYGIPIGGSEHTTGLHLVTAALGALARPMAFGTAARAGIVRDDLVTQLNGVPLAGLGAAQLDDVIRKAELAGGSYVAAVTHADGTVATYRFSSQDLAGYLKS